MWKSVNIFANYDNSFVAYIFCTTLHTTQYAEQLTGS